MQKYSAFIYLYLYFSFLLEVIVRWKAGAILLMFFFLNAYQGALYLLNKYL